MPKRPSSRAQSPSGSTGLPFGTIVRAPAGSQSTSRSGSSCTTVHGRAFQTRPCQISRTATLSPLDRIPTLRELRDRPRRIRLPVLPPARPRPLLEHPLALCAHQGGRLLGDPASCEGCGEVLLVLPAPGAVSHDH